jgi:8-hydroxy-5-deazaflavin:NADPH oxidoreductase
MATKEKVGVLGSGEVGKALATGFARHGYEVMIGSREPGKLDDWARGVPGRVTPGSFAKTAAFAELVVLATNGQGTESALALAGAQNFRGKLVLDATNPLDLSKGMPPTLFVGTTDSLGERVQRRLPDAKVVKCFNTVSNPKMIDPAFAEGVPPMLICGNDAGSKQRTVALLKELGWPGALDVGGIDSARWLEAHVMLWVRSGMALQRFDHAFKVVEEGPCDNPWVRGGRERPCRSAPARSSCSYRVSSSC